MADGSVKYNICVAMCAGSRGFALDQNLPWPKLQKDVNYYLDLTSRSSPGKKAVNLYGRKSWESAQSKEITRPKVINIIISRTIREPPKYAQKVCRSLSDALQYLASAEMCDKFDTVWLMGGQELYEESIDHLSCERIHVTQIYTDFPANRFFPKFEHKFAQISDPAVDPSLHEDSGIKFRFEVWARNKTQ